MKPSWLEMKKGCSSLLLTSLLNLPCSLPHTLATSCSNAYTHCICFVVDLPPPGCECCGLLQHCYYGIVSGCDENRHKQLCARNENNNTHEREKKDANTKGSADLCVSVGFSHMHFVYTQLLNILYTGIYAPSCWLLLVISPFSVVSFLPLKASKL